MAPACAGDRGGVRACGGERDCASAPAACHAAALGGMRRGGGASSPDGVHAEDGPGAGAACPGSGACTPVWAGRAGLRFFKASAT